MQNAPLRLVLALILGALLAACGSNSPGGVGGVPATPLSDLAGTYNGEFQIDDSSNGVFMNGLATFTVSGRTISGTFTADNDFDFPDDTGTFSGTITSTSDYGFFDGEVTIDFEAAPDYTASGRFIYGGESRVLQAANFTLRRDGNFAGNFFLDGNKE